MKSIIIGAAMLAGSIPALAQTNVSINIGQPGFYGRIDIGDYAPPQVVYERPVIVRPARHYEARPVYLRVPPGHRNHWSKHCGRYNACGQRVLFVRDEWYTNTYAPRYREQYRDREYRADHDRGPERIEYRDERGHGGGHGRGDDKHDKHDSGHGHGRGHD